MAKGETDKSPPATSATTATRGASELDWKKTKVAEDELSILWKRAAQIENLEQASEAARQSQLDNFWPQIEAFAKRCDEVLHEYGFPAAAEMVRHDGAGNWWRHPLDAPKQPPIGETWKFTPGHALAQEFSDDFSDAWYAGRIGFKSRLALEHFRKGDSGTPHLFSLIFEIATLRNDWQWRRGNKPSILTGRKQRKTLADHRSTANEKQREGMLARREAIVTLLRETNRKLTGGALERYLCKRLKDRFEIKASLRTIRRDLSQI
jgi:hypothetical protein